jgi:ribosomal peptide maturation radical SAM protein 1
MSSPSNDFRVLLVCMPFAGVGNPALGVSLLKSELERAGTRCDVIYPNLDFAEAIGLETYRAIAHGVSISNLALAGEWLFSQYFYGPGSLDAQGYVDTVLRSELNVPESQVRQLRDLRATVGPFLRRIFESVRWENYGLVGFTTTFEQNFPSLCLARIVKAALPEVPIVFGGANCEAEMGVELHRQFDFIDFVARGEADVTLPDLVDCLRVGCSPGRVSGLVWRSEGGTEVNELGSLVRDLDALPYPDYSDYFDALSASRLSRRIVPRLMMESARGCWWGERRHCTFCGLNGAGMAFRSKAPERLLAEVDYLVARWGIANIAFVDNILDIRYFESVLPDLARRQQPLRLFYETKANLRKDQVALLRAAGVAAIQPGIESLSSEVLSLMQKGVRGLQNVQLLKWCREFGVEVAWNLLYGFPHESRDAYEHTLEVLQAITHLDQPQAVTQIRLDRFSPNLNEAAERGFTNVRPLTAYQFVYSCSEDALRDICYFFEYDYADGRVLDDYVRPVVDFCREWSTQTDRGDVKHRRLPSGAAIVDDTRFNRISARVELSAAENSIIEFCDKARTLVEIDEHLSIRAGVAEDGLEAVALVDRLIANRLMVSEGKRFLSVVIASPANDAPGSPMLIAGNSEPAGRREWKEVSA